MKNLCIIDKNMRKLWSCERGAVAPLVGICAIMLVGAVAVAVDVGRGQVAQSKLQAALDAAGLAAGAVVSQNLDEEDLKPEAWKYLKENFAGATVSATITLEDFDLELSEDQMLVTLEARANLPTTFMRIFGRDTMQVAARTEITREMTGLEVALVVDVTGSMTGDVSDEDETEKIVALRAAADDLMGILFGNNDTVDDLWVGIVPFSQTVNVGLDRTDWLTDYTSKMAYDNCVGWNHTNWPHSHVAGESTTGRICSSNGPNVSTRTFARTLVNDWLDAPDPTAPKVVVPNGSWNGPLSPWYFRPHAWGGCVRERYASGRDVTDDPLSTEKFPTYFAPYASNNEWVRLPNDFNSSTGAYNNKGGAYRVDVGADRSANHGCPMQPITVMTNDKSDLQGAVANLINPRGNTHVNVGAIWGWRLLSPEWNGDWGGTMNDNDLPLDYDEELSQKVMILMTDGDNTMPGSFATAYGFLSEGNLGTTDLGDAEDELDARLTTICNAMKAKGIIIYTIGFGDELNGGSLALLQNCASANDFFFDARTSADLTTAFHTIGDALSKLRVSK